MNDTHCPFCNAPLPVLAAPALGKQPCPRCGEPVPGDRWPVDPGLATSLRAGPAPAPVSSPPDFRAANRRIAWTLLGIIASMAIIGLSYALWTKQARRGRDPKKIEKFEPIAARRPSELAALGYLPKDCQIVAGFHFAEMQTDKSGQELLAVPRPALLDFSIKQIARTTGMKIDDLDHVVLAATFDASLPQLASIIRTRGKISLEKIAEARPIRAQLFEDRPLYLFALDPLNVAVWCVDERTLICVTRLDEPKVEHLRGFSATPKKIEEAAPGELAKLMNERLPGRPYAWVVGRLDQLGPMLALAPLFLGGKTDLAAWNRLQKFAVGIEPMEGLTLKGEFLLADAKAAAEFKTYLDGISVDGARSRKAETAPPQEKEQWVAWQVRGDVLAVRELLNRGRAPKKN